MPNGESVTSDPGALWWPRAETPTHYITMCLNDDLNACATLAVRELIDWAASRFGYVMKLPNEAPKQNHMGFACGLFLLTLKSD